MESNYTLDMESGPFEKLLSLAEAAEIWRVDESTIRKAIAAGKLYEGHDCRKFGKQWVITVDAMARVFNRTACKYDYMPWSDYLVELRKARAAERGKIPVS